MDIIKRYVALVVENAKLRRQIWHMRKLLAYYQENFKREHTFRSMLKPTRK